MRHASEGTIRRLIDQPLAVGDAETAHVAGCGRCRDHKARVESDASAAVALLARPQLVADATEGWDRFQQDPRRPAVHAGGPRVDRLRSMLLDARRRTWRLAAVPAPPRRVALAACAALVLVASGAVATWLVSAPAPAPATDATVAADFQAIADVAGLGGGAQALGDFQTPSGSTRLPFGLLTWSSAGSAHLVGSLAEAERQTGLQLATPARLPSGVGGPERILVQPKVTAVIRFGQAAGAGLAGTSLEVTAGPAVLLEYGGVSSGPSPSLPTLAIFAMAGPIASAMRASPGRLEAYLLSEPGLPAGLEQELRLLGQLRTVLPMPPAGSDVSQVDVDGSPGILVAEPSGVASGVIWVDRSRIVRAAVGLLDGKDVLDAADQLG